MTPITLSKTETTLLLEAAGGDGAISFPDSVKHSSRERILGRLLRDELIAIGGAGHALTPAGYRAIGLKPPRANRSAAASIENQNTSAPKPTKGALVLTLLGREEGASLSELTDATGWLPHTTRAALSRLRSAGTPLAKSKREDGTTSYRIAAEEPVAPKRGRAQRQRPEVAEAAAG